jgi:hypothetical protein
MNKVTVKREALLDTIRSNRDAHRAEFLRAQDGFRARAIEELDRRLADARAGRRIALLIQLPEPQDHTVDYDRVIRMLEMSINQEIELTAQEFDQFVMDNWSWAQMSKMINASYAR